MDSTLPLGKHIDILAIGAYPSQVEVGVGGILLKMAHRGYTTVIGDLTGGETGIPDDQSGELHKAGKILHVSDRINLALADSPFDLVMEHATMLAECMCKCRPDIILVPFFDECDPLYPCINQLIHKSLHIARKSSTPYAPLCMFHYTLGKSTIPQAVVNVTSVFEGKMEAIRIYQSRFMEAPPPGTPFSTPYKDFIFHVESQARHLGSLIHCRFGEGLILGRPVPIEDICEFVNL